MFGLRGEAQGHQYVTVTNKTTHIPVSHTHTQRHLLGEVQFPQRKGQTKRMRNRKTGKKSERQRSRNSKSGRITVKGGTNRMISRESEDMWEGALTSLWAMSKIHRITDK